MIYLYIILFILAIIYAIGYVTLLFVWIFQPILNVVNFFAVLIVYFNKERFLETTSKYLLENSKQADIDSHYNHRAFWNLTSSKKDIGTKFGHNKEKRDETLSSMFGRKKEEKSLKGLGWFMYYFLYIVDYKNWWWFYKKQGHCAEAHKSYKNK